MRSRVEVKQWLIDNSDIIKKKGYIKRLKSKYKNIILEINNITNYLSEDIKLSERIYHILNDIYETPKCKRNECNNYVKFYFYYPNFCCQKCAGKDGDRNKKSASTLKKKMNEDKDFKNKVIERLPVGEQHRNFKGWVSKLNLPLYETYASQLTFVEEVRRNPEDSKLLQVKCTYCSKWIQPTKDQVHNKVGCLKGIQTGEQRFYCPGNSCRSQCSIYNRRQHPKGYDNDLSREVQPELQKLVFERDPWVCKSCGSIKFLHCHHIDPVINNPIESADVDNCITLYKDCHKDVHRKPGCRYNELRC